MSVTLLPAWKNVVAAIEAGRWTFGDLVSHEDIDELLNLKKPAGGDSADALKAYQLRRLNETTAMAEHLLTEHKMFLRIETGLGYRIVTPEDQTRMAEADLAQDLSKAFRVAGQRIGNIRADMLTAEAIRQNADARVRLAAKEQAVRRVNRMSVEAIRSETRRSIKGPEVA